VRLTSSEPFASVGGCTRGELSGPPGRVVVLFGIRPGPKRGQPWSTVVEVPDWTAIELRVHILGASGSGTTTLASSLAERWSSMHLDTDDYYWEPTDPPYQSPRPSEQRQALLVRDARAHASWVLSGSLCGWGDVLISRFELVVFLWVPTEVRIARLRKRELEKFGADALAPGGRMHENHREFLEWAASYDEGDMRMRSMARHQGWLSRLPCPVVRCEGELPLADQIQRVLDAEKG